MYELVEKHRRYLPHLQEAGQIISLTWRLEGSLPRSILALLDEMKSIMREIEAKADHPARFELYAEYHQSLDLYDDQSNLVIFNQGCGTEKGYMMNITNLR